MQRQRFENCVKNSSVLKMLKKGKESSARRQSEKVGR